MHQNSTTNIPRFVDSKEIVASRYNDTDQLSEPRV